MRTQRYTSANRLPRAACCRHGFFAAWTPLLRAAVLFLLTAALAGPAAAAVCRVDANGNATAPDGQTWGTAFADLQAALGNPVCEEIWVARGVYVPVVPALASSVSDAERQASFVIPPGVAVYGGFAGTETSRDARNLVANPTVLSGDIDRNDANAGGSGIDDSADDIVGRNSLHVLRMDGVSGASVGTDTVLDSLIVSGGNAESLSGYPVPTQMAGGGLYCDAIGVDPGDRGHACSPRLSNLEFRGNRAWAGGAMACITYYGDCHPLLDNVRFSGNEAVGAGVPLGGGGLLVYDMDGSSAPLLTDVLFVDNHALGNINGGGMSIFSAGGGQASLTRVIFSGNSGQSGGGLAVNGPNALIAAPGAVLEVHLSEARFIDNQAAEVPAGQTTGGDGSGGGLLCIDCQLTIGNASFRGNRASSGGAIALLTALSATTATLDNVSFHDNTASKFGGAMSTLGSPAICPLLNHVTFHNDHASMLIPQTSSLELSLGASGGSCRARIGNSIVWNDTVQGGNRIFATFTAVDIDHSIVTDGCPIDLLNHNACDTVLSADPALGALQDNGGFTPTMLPAAGSAALDAASCSGPASDQRGMPRPQGASCDIGAVERARATALDVVVTGAGRVDAAARRADLQLAGAIRACTAAGGASCHAEFAQQAQIDFRATADPHWHFGQWGDACSGSDAATSLTLGADSRCTAQFEIDRFTVSASAAGGHGAIAPATQQVPYDGTAAFTVTPDVGYHLAGFSADTCSVLGAGASWRADHIQAACAVNASFAINRYTVTYRAGAHGTLSDPTPQSVEYGADGMRVSAIPAPHYHFVQWSDGRTDNPRQDTDVRADIDVTAGFAIDRFLVEARVDGGHGRIEPATQMGDFGARLLFTLVPDPGYKVTDADGCGGALDGNSYRTGALEGACTVTARFVRILPPYQAVPALGRRGLLWLAGLLVLAAGLAWRRAQGR